MEWLRLAVVALFLMDCASGDYYSSRHNIPSFSPMQLRQMKKLYDKLSMPNSTDAILLFDTSNGISQWTFNEMKRLCRIALNCLQEQLKHTRLAMFSFGNTVKRVMDFDDCPSTDCISQSLETIRLTNTPGRALGQALKESKRMFRKYGKYPNRIIVVVTYGASNRGRSATVVARKLKKNSKAEIFVIAVGRNALRSKGELVNIAGVYSKHSTYYNHLYLNNEQRFYGELSVAKGYLSAMCSRGRFLFGGFGKRGFTKS